MATGRVPTTANSPLTAKGDLFTYDTSQARLAVGNNGDTLVADSSATTGLRWNPTIAAGKNFAINGNFDIWQRGTSFAANGYMADRWSNASDWSNVTFSQQTTGAPAGSRYVARLTSTGASSYMSLYQPLETFTAAAMWGQTVTLSIKLRTNATANNTGITIGLNKNSTADAALLGAGWSSLASTNIARGSLPTTAGTSTATWFTATLTASVPADGTANSLAIVVQYNGATANGSIYEYSQVQLEIGSTATTFSRAGGTLAGELAACQRYYYLAVDGTNKQFGIGQMDTNTAITGYFTFPVTMRTTPTLSATSGTNYYSAELTAGQDFFNSLTILRAHTNGSGWYNSSEISGTAGQCKQLYTSNASASIAFSAEL